MSIINAVKTLGIGTSVSSVPLNPSTYRSLMSEMFLPGGQGPIQMYTYKDRNSAVEAYTKCPPLTAIINKMAQAHVNGKTWIMSTEGTNKGKEATSAYAKALRARLAAPNPLQTWTQFEAQQKIFIHLFGWCPVLPIKPFGRNNIEDITSMWNIPTNICTPKENKKLFYKANGITDLLDSIQISYRGETSELPLDKLFIFKDIVPSFETIVFPESRICSLEMPINNIIGAYNSRNVLINYRGALGIISSESDKNGYIPIKDPDKVALQNDFRRYGLLNQQWKFIITSAAVKWQQMGVPTKDLMLFEEIQDDIYRLCDSFNFPSPLMASDKNNALGGSNQDPAKQSLYTDCTIPDAISLYEQWNIFFKTAENGVDIQKDFSKIPCLQKDAQKGAQARKTLNDALLIEFHNNILTVNRWLELNGEDTLGNEGEVYYTDWVAAGKVFGAGPLQQQNNNPNPGSESEPK